MPTLAARWRSLGSHDALQRSSHGLAVHGDRALVFGGELKPRTPVDAALTQLSLVGASLLAAHFVIQRTDELTLFSPCRRQDEHAQCVYRLELASVAGRRNVRRVRRQDLLVGRARRQGHE